MTAKRGFDQGRKRVGLCTLAVWRLVAAGGWSGAAGGHIVVKLEHRYDFGRIRESLRTLREAGYIVYVGDRQAGVYRATGKLPLGEERPAWMDEPPLAPTMATKLPRPQSSPFEFGRSLRVAPTAALQMPPPCRQIARSGRTRRTLITLNSDGVLQIDGDDGQQVTLGPQTTLDLFQWLDNLRASTLVASLSPAAS